METERDDLEIFKGRIIGLEREVRGNARREVQFGGTVRTFSRSWGLKRES